MIPPGAVTAPTRPAVASEDDPSTVHALRADWVADRVAAHTNYRLMAQAYERMCPCGSGLLAEWRSVRDGDLTRTVTAPCAVCRL